MTVQTGTSHFRYILEKIDLAHDDTEWGRKLHIRHEGHKHVMNKPPRTTGLSTAAAKEPQLDPVHRTVHLYESDQKAHTSTFSFSTTMYILKGLL